jgi:hypothetical protein
MRKAQPGEVAARGDKLANVPIAVSAVDRFSISATALG